MERSCDGFSMAWRKGLVLPLVTLVAEEKMKAHKFFCSLFSSFLLSFFSVFLF